MDISQVPELVNNEGYPLMIDAYNGVDMMHPRFCRVETLTDDLLYGTKGSVITGMGEPIERNDGEEFHRDEFRSARTWYMQTHQWGNSFEIPERMVLASDAVGRITNLIQGQVRTFGYKAALKKDKWVADILQQGTLTAGNAKYFDGSFPDNADPYPKFIFDGLPFFDGAHPIAIGSSTFSNINTSLPLTSANLQTALTTMRYTNNVDERGDKIMVRPDTMIVPTALEGTAMELLESQLKPGTANNDINIHRARLNLMVWDFLDDAASASAWWLCEANSESLVVYDRGEPRIEIVWKPERKVWMVTMETHFGAVVKDWRQWYAANKADS